MRLQNLLTLFFFCAICTSSCKKNTTPTPKTIVDTDLVYTTPYPDYLVLKPGNYWIYQTYTINADSAAPANYIDSFYVGSDTLIGSNTYHKLVKNIRYFETTQVYFLRDSASFVVTNTGQIFFSSQDFNTVFQTIQYTNPAAGIFDTIPVTTQMGFQDSLTTVPIGVFESNTFRQIYFLSPPAATQEYDWKYAENIGLLTQTVGRYSYPGTPWFEDRLIRYHVE